MNREYLKNVIVDQKELIQIYINSQRIIQRQGVQQCKKYLSYPNVLLISGLRRAGKSIFSNLLIQSENYAAINFDDERLINFKTEHFNQLLETYYELYGDCQYLLFDEIQNINGWELFINRLRLKYKIIITGSNARLLSPEMATHLTGRFDSFTVFPMNFQEYLDFNSIATENINIYSTKDKATIANLFFQYLRQGGIFEYYKFGKDHIRSLFSSIIMKDIVTRYQIRFPVVLEELAVLLVNSFAAKFSANKASKILKLKSPHTIKEYLSYLENTFLIFKVEKFSYKLQEQKSSFPKIYISDNGIIDSLLFDFSSNKGRLLENIVAIELKRLSYQYGFSFFYWNNYSNECDFIIQYNNKIVNICQVCYELNEHNQQREFNGIIKAANEFGLKEGIVLTMSQEFEKKIQNVTIKVIPVWKWLLQENKMSS